MYYSQSLIQYFDDLKELTPLSQNEEISLGQKIKNGSTSALNKLVKYNLRLVIVIAKRFQGQGLSLDDLIQEGNIGLIEAAQKYDSSNKNRFSSYAQLWIRKRINEAIAQVGRLVRLPHNQEYEVYKQKVAGENVSAQGRVYLDAPLDDENRQTIGDLFNQYEFNESSIDHQQLTALLDKLDNREKFVIKAYFGIEQDINWPTDRIAEELGIGSTRVNQIIKTALTKLAA